MDGQVRYHHLGWRRKTGYGGDESETGWNHGHRNSLPNDDQQWAIHNGKLEKGKLTFEVLLEGNGGDNGKLVFDLVFDGETIKGSAAGTSPDGDKMSAKVELKRL